MSEYDGLSAEVRMCLDPDSAEKVLRLMRKAFSLQGDIKNMSEKNKRLAQSRNRLNLTVDRLIDENECLRKALRYIRDETPDYYEVRSRISEALEYAAIELPEEA